jgi:hypothetical protein
MPNKPSPRFKRASTVAPIQLTKRDREIIRLVHRHRFLRSHQIVALLDASQQQVLRRLKSLYHHGYLLYIPVATLVIGIIGWIVSRNSNC